MGTNRMYEQFWKQIGTGRKSSGSPTNQYCLSVLNIASYRYLHTRLLSDKQLGEVGGEAGRGGTGGTGGIACDGWDCNPGVKKVNVREPPRRTPWRAPPLRRRPRCEAPGDARNAARRVVAARRASPFFGCRWWWWLILFSCPRPWAKPSPAGGGGAAPKDPSFGSPTPGPGMTWGEAPRSPPPSGGSTAGRPPASKRIVATGVYEHSFSACHGEE